MSILLAPHKVICILHPHTALPTHPSFCPCPGHHRRFSQPVSPLRVQAPPPRAAASFFRDPTPSSGPFLAGEIHGGWCLWCFASTGDKHSKTHALHCPALDLRVLGAPVREQQHLHALKRKQCSTRAGNIHSKSPPAIQAL